jgi:tetratricopeptide (TPR) repeat protein
MSIDITRMPSSYDDDFLGVRGSAHPDGIARRTVVHSIVFPPLGFFPFGDIGNGDYFGLYWPLGQEDAPPIVACSSHDAFALIPEYGSLATAGLCQMARDEDRKLSHEFQFALDAVGLRYPWLDFADAVAGNDHQRLLMLDPNSPFRNCAVADQAIAENELEIAEIHYKKSLELLPEYGAAHFALGYLMRRVRRQKEASIHLRQSLMCPMVFWGGSFWAEHRLPGAFRNDWSRKALLWLQQLREIDESLADDPFMYSIQEINLKTGVAKSHDIDVLMKLASTYQDRNQVLDAFHVWSLIGERAAFETTSFRERYGLTARLVGDQQARLLREVGNARRAELLESLLLMMEKPEGLYL